MNRNLRVGFCLAASFAVATPAFAEVQLSAAATLSTNREMTISFVRYFINEVNARGKGKVHINFKGGPEVMPPGKQAQACGRGVLDITHSPGAYYAGQVPEANLLQVSNMTPDEFRKSGGFAMLDKIHQKKLNVKILGWGDSSGTFNTYLTRKPIYKADGTISLKGYKMRSTATYRPLFLALGAIPVAMPAGDIYTALQRGVIDGFGQTSSGLVALGVKGVVKYRIDPSYYRINNFILINLDKWKSLPKADKDLLHSAALNYEKGSARFYLEAAKVDEKALVGAGMQIIHLKGKAAKVYLKAADDGVINRITKEVGADEVKALLAKEMK